MPGIIKITPQRTATSAWRARYEYMSIAFVGGVMLSVWRASSVGCLPPECTPLCSPPHPVPLGVPIPQPGFRKIPLAPVAQVSTSPGLPGLGEVKGARRENIGEGWPEPPDRTPQKWGGESELADLAWGIRRDPSEGNR